MLLAVAGIAVADPSRAATFEATSSLPDSYHLHAMVGAGDRLYSLGGLSGTTGVGGARDTFAATIAAGGALEEWTPGPLLPEAVFEHGAVAYGGFVYVLGGQHYTPSGLGPSSIVYVSKIGADGTLGAWQETTPLAEPSFLLGATQWQGRIYVSGGYNGAGLSTGVYSAPVQADGALGPWRAESPLPEATYGHAMVAEGSLFVLGGVIDNGATLVDTVYEASIGSDGVLGDWSAARSLPEPLASFGAVAAQGELIALGGWDGLQARADVISAQVAGGALAPWQPFAALPEPRQRLAAALAAGYLYASGGVLDTPRADVYFGAAPVPEPQIYASLFAGLALFRFIRRRRGDHRSPAVALLICSETARRTRGCSRP